MTDAAPNPATANEPPIMTVRSHNRALRLPVDGSLSVRTALDTTELRVRAACGGQGSCGACLIQTLDGDFNPPTLAERQKLLPDDLATGMRLACQLRPLGRCELYLEHPAPRSHWKCPNSERRYRAVRNPAIDQAVYGVAVDLGTTHIRLSLWNRQSGRFIASRYGINPQTAHGADVLTRLDAEQMLAPEKRHIGRMARYAIVDGIKDILSRDVGEVTPMLAQIGKILIVGNTAMLTLLCGNDGQQLYDPENWQKPLICHADNSASWRKDWRMPNVAIHIVQPLAGFIGSDLPAALIATAITDQKQPILLADFGTNTEIALWDGRTVWATSIPGGPAFEAVGIRNGMSADSGAICQVLKSADGWQLKTLDDAPVRGFCASGFIDAIAGLLAEQQIKPSGRFLHEPAATGFLLDANNPRTAIFAGDVDIFQRAKASTAAAMTQLLAVAGLTLNDLSALWICGSFGRHLDLASAFQVGLLPPLGTNKVRMLADASLAGCERLLLDPAGQALLDAIVERTRVLNLANDLEYENRFIDNLRLQPMPLVDRP